MTKRSEDTNEPMAVADNPARELVSILVRGKWTALLVFLVASGLVTYGVLRQPPLYEAESSLLVRIGREYVYRPEVGRNENARTPSLSEMVNSEVEILSSRDLAEQVVREIGVEKLYPDVLELVPDPAVAAEVAVLNFRKSASIRPVLESSVIKVSFEHEVPAVAAEAVNRLVEHFKDKHVEVFGEERASRLESQLAEKNAHLVEVEDALAAFKRDHGVYDIQEQRKLLLDRRESLDRDLRTIESELAALRLRAGDGGQDEPPDAPAGLPPYLRPEMKEELLRQRSDLELALRGFEPPASDRTVEQASLRLLDLELEASRLRRDFTPENRKVQSVEAEIEHVRRFLEQAETRAGVFDQARREERDVRGQELTAEIERLTTEIELLVQEEERQARLEARRSVQVLETQRSDRLARLEALDLELRALDQQEQPLRRLERDLAGAEAAAQTYRERVDEARITDELDREKHINVRVIEKAAAPVAPSGLPRNVRLAMGGFVALLAAVGATVLLDLFRSR